MTVNRTLLSSVKKHEILFRRFLPVETFYLDTDYNSHTAFQGFSLWEDGVVLKRTESVFVATCSLLLFDVLTVNVA